jgi:hypothetical protein
MCYPAVSEKAGPAASHLFLVIHFIVSAFFLKQKLNRGKIDDGGGKNLCPHGV